MLRFVNGVPDRSGAATTVSGNSKSPYSRGRFRLVEIFKPEWEAHIDRPRLPYLRSRDGATAQQAKPNPPAPEPAGRGPRPFRLGVTRWPPDLTLDAVAQTEAFIRTNCDMAAPMFIDGVP